MDEICRFPFSGRDVFRINRALEALELFTSQLQIYISSNVGTFSFCISQTNDTMTRKMNSGSVRDSKFSRCCFHHILDVVLGFCLLEVRFCWFRSRL